MPKTCEHEGCLKQPTFNTEDQSTGRFCKQHKQAGMVDVTSKRCEHEECDDEQLVAKDRQIEQLIKRPRTVHNNTTNNRDVVEQHINVFGKESIEQTTPEHIQALLADPANAERVVAMASPITTRNLLRHKERVGWHKWRCLQRYVHDPPGENMAILYLKFFPTSGKGYVGQHRHAMSGKSYATSRMLRCRNKGSTYLYRAMAKHHAVHFILAHVHEDEIDKLEIAAIAHFGTRAPRGYNLDSGGKNPTRHPETLAKQRAALQSESVKHKIREGMRRADEATGFRARAVATIRSNAQNPSVRQDLQNRMKRLHADPDVQRRRRASCAAAMRNPEVQAKRVKTRRENPRFDSFRELMRAITKKRFEDPDYRSKHAQAVKAAKNRPEAKEMARQRMRARLSDPLVRSSMSAASASLRRSNRPQKESAELESSLESCSTWQEAEIARMDHERRVRRRALERGEARPLTQNEKSTIAKRRAELDPDRDKKKQKRRSDLHVRWADPVKKARVCEKIQSTHVARNESLREAIWAAYRRYHIVHGDLNVPTLYGKSEAERDGIAGIDTALGKITQSIRSKFTHIRSCPSFATWLRHHGFRMSMRSDAENDSRWASATQVTATST